MDASPSNNCQLKTETLHYVYAPAINPNPRGPQPSGDLVEYIQIRWRYLEYAGHGPGHYALLRQRLEDLADRLARRIDGN